MEAVRRVSWRVAYAGLIGQSYIDRATAVPSGISHSAPWRRTLVAVAGGSSGAAGGSPAVAGCTVVGYTAFGPERSGLAPQPGRGRADRLPLTPAGLAGAVGEVYAIYVAPDWWSTGTGRLLMEAAVASLVSAGYQRAVLWVLDTNARARRFYEKAGWAPDGAANTMAALGGVVEVRYTRPLSLGRPASRRACVAAGLLPQAGVAAGLAAGRLPQKLAGPRGGVQQDRVAGFRVQPQARLGQLDRVLVAGRDGPVGEVIGRWGRYLGKWLGRDS